VPENGGSSGDGEWMSEGGSGDISKDSKEGTKKGKRRQRRRNKKVQEGSGEFDGPSAELSGELSAAENLSDTVADVSDTAAKAFSSSTLSAEKSEELVQSIERASSALASNRAEKCVPPVEATNGQDPTTPVVGIAPHVSEYYDSVPVLEQTKLPRGGVSVDTKAVGRVQVRFESMAILS
jgi:hypothetical protein